MLTLKELFCNNSDHLKISLLKIGYVMSKRTWQPKKLKRLRKHGFLKRMSSPGGKNVIKARRAKGRKQLSVTTGTK